MKDNTGNSKGALAKEANRATGNFVKIQATSLVLYAVYLAVAFAISEALKATVQQWLGPVTEVRQQWAFACVMMVLGLGITLVAKSYAGVVRPA